MHTRLPIAALALALAGCNAAPVATTPEPAPTPGLAFAQQRCAKCHAVEPPFASPNPEAPSFDAIASAPGLTRDTLRTFLRDSHNFPGQMQFDVAPGEIENLVGYMMTLREE
jgi:mono/diheme cytochrome c family protein